VSYWVLKTQFLALKTRYFAHRKLTGFVGVGAKKYRLLTKFLLGFTGYLLGTLTKPSGKACLTACWAYDSTINQKSLMRAFQWYSVVV
jgi:hypothetical protein